ncbi:MAG: DUF4340 domain-containing protein [Deltaproteobacteria bacterium]|nr:DUF4340 domain-containing protein [Deltaproteobacteria bacterium]
MKNKGAMIAVAVFGALLIVVLATREKQVSVGIRKMDVKTVDKDKVTGFEMSGAKAAVLRKEGDLWLVSDPAKADKKFPVDDYAIKSAVDAVAELTRSADFVTDKADKHAEYEVDDAKGLRVRVATAEGTPLDLVFGKFAKGGGTYVRQAGDNAVFSTKARLGSLLKKDVAQWRKRQLMTAKAEDFKEATLKTAKGDGFTFVSDDGKEWKLKEGTVTPAGFRFDSAAAGRLGSNIANLRAQEFLEAGQGDDAALALDAAHDEVIATQKDGKVITVHVGRELDAKIGAACFPLKNNFDAIDTAGTKDGRITPEDLTAAAADKTRAEDVKKAIEAALNPEFFAVLDTGAWGFKPKDGALTQDDLEAAQKTATLVPVRVVGDAQIYLVPQYSVQQVRKKLTDYRDLGVLAFDLDKVRKVTINVGKKTVAQKDGAEWKIVEPKELPPGFEFEGTQVQSQLTMLKNLKASRLVEPALPDAQTGLNKPVGTIELELEDKTVVSLRFGKDTTNDKGAKEVFVRGNADGALYAAGEYLKKRYENGVEVFRKPKPPPNMGGMGGMNGLESLPPDVRKKLEAQLKNAR